MMDNVNNDAYHGDTNTMEPDNHTCEWYNVPNTGDDILDDEIITNMVTLENNRTNLYFDMVRNGEIDPLDYIDTSDSNDVVIEPEREYNELNNCDYSDDYDELYAPLPEYPDDDDDAYFDAYDSDDACDEQDIYCDIPCPKSSRQWSYI